MANRETGIKKAIRAFLEKPGPDGSWQFELDHSLGFAKSYISDTLKLMEKHGEIVKLKEGEKVVKIWATEYYPFPIPKAVRIWMLRASEYIPLLYLLYSVFLKRGYKVIIHVAESGDEINRALTVGYADIGFLPSLTAMISCYSSGRTQMLTGIASGGSAILENTKSKGNLVATTNASSMYALADLHFREKSERFSIFENQEEAARKFRSGKFRFLVIWEPYLSRYLKDSGTVKISGYEEHLGSIPCCILSANRNYLKTNREILEISVTEYEGLRNERIEEGFLDQNFVKELLKVFPGFTLEELKDSLKGLKLHKGILLGPLEKLRKLLNVPIAEETILNCLE